MTDEKANLDVVAPFKVKPLEGFVAQLNALPEKTSIASRKGTGSEIFFYVPISHVENKLDEFFFGLWQTKDFRYQVVANEIIGTILLGIYHPILKQWIWREGAAAVMIQQKKNSDITDIGAKYKNTLEKDFPHLKSDCLRNAAKSLGKVFGRDLNRSLEDEYHKFTEQMEERSGAVLHIEKCDTPEALTKLWADNPDWHDLTPVIEAFTARKKFLTPKKSLNG